MIYRDRKTGRFAKKSTWKRSRARDGTRYVRERSERRRKPVTGRGGGRAPSRLPRSLPQATRPHLWRVTMAAPYYRRGKGKKRQSISAAYMVRAWFDTKKEAENELDSLRKRAIKGRQDILSDPRNKSWGELDVEIQPIKKVAYERQLSGVVEERDER